MIDSKPNDSLRVLVVEDEALVALVLEDMLVELGHQVIGPVSSVSEGLEIARDQPLDIAILDVNIRGASSSSIATVLAARGIPVIFSTGYGRGGLPEPFSRAPLLQKPFQQADIEIIIQSARKNSALTADRDLP